MENLSVDADFVLRPIQSHKIRPVVDAEFDDVKNPIGGEEEAIIVSSQMESAKPSSVSSHFITDAELSRFKTSLREIYKERQKNLIRLSRRTELGKSQSNVSRRATERSPIVKTKKIPSAKLLTVYECATALEFYSHLFEKLKVDCSWSKSFIRVNQKHLNDSDIGHKINELLEILLHLRSCISSRLEYRDSEPCKVGTTPQQDSDSDRGTDSLNDSIYTAPHEFKKTTSENGDIPETKREHNLTSGDSVPAPKENRNPADADCGVDVLADKSSDHLRQSEIHADLSGVSILFRQSKEGGDGPRVQSFDLPAPLPANLNSDDISDEQAEVQDARAQELEELWSARRVLDKPLVRELIAMSGND